VIRIVLDTNVLVSALLKPAGAECSMVERVGARTLTPCLSPAVLDEYLDVLRRPKFRFDPNYVRVFLDTLLELSLLVAPARALSVCPDPADDRFLECAEAADADYLVTGNKRHFPAQWLRTRVVNARELLASLL
jgi:putative PIN family toxin of toxin-antitoxin system